MGDKESVNRRQVAPTPGSRTGPKSKKKAPAEAVVERGVVADTKSTRSKQTPAQRAASLRNIQKAREARNT